MLIYPFDCYSPRNLCQKKIRVEIATPQGPQVFLCLHIVFLVSPPSTHSPAQDFTNRHSYELKKKKQVSHEHEHVEHQLLTTSTVLAKTPLMPPPSWHPDLTTSIIKLCIGTVPSLWGNPCVADVVPGLGDLCANSSARRIGRLWHDS